MAFDSLTICPLVRFSVRIVNSGFFQEQIIGKARLIFIELAPRKNGLLQGEMDREPCRLHLLGAIMALDEEAAGSALPQQGT